MAARAGRGLNPVVGLYTDDRPSSGSTSRSQAPSEASYRLPRPVSGASYASSSYPGTAANSTVGSRRSLNSRPEPAQDEVGLKKRVGLVSGTALIVGTMIGSGIFISPQGLAKGTGSVGLSLVSWVICGVISMLAGVSYAELGTFIPKSGAEYAYLLEGYGGLHAFLGPLPAFLFNWVNNLLLKPAAVAIISLAFAVYAIQPAFDFCPQPEVATKCLAALCILVLCLVNCLSVRAATWLQNAFTVTKLAAILIIIIGGVVNLAKGHTRYLASGFAGTETATFGSVTIALYKGMWAYDGWNNLNYVTEELVNPYVNLPRAILIGIPLVTVCYVLVNVSYFTVLSIDELIEAPAVAVVWGNRSLGVMSWLIPLSVVCSCFGAANGTLFSTGRLSYVAAREGHMVELLSMIHVKRHTPLPSLVFTSVLALIMVIPGNIEGLIDFFNFAVWFFYGGTMVALLVMRYTHRDVVRPYKVPIVFPVIVLLASVWLVVAPIVVEPKLEFLFAFLFIVAGLIFYVPFVYFKVKIPGTEAVTGFLQLLMEVSTPSEESTC